MSLVLLGILNSQAAAAGGAGAYDLLETQVLTSSASSVSFSSISQNYKHLQLRVSARSDRAATSTAIQHTFNNDTSNNYKIHGLDGNGSSVSSFERSLRGYFEGLVYGTTAESDNFVPEIYDILDYTNTSKNTTVRGLLGGASSSAFNAIRLMSGLWLDTSAVTTLTLTCGSLANFIAGSRFSLYGIKGA